MRRPRQTNKKVASVSDTRSRTERRGYGNGPRYYQRQDKMEPVCKNFFVGSHQTEERKEDPKNAYPPTSSHTIINTWNQIGPWLLCTPSLISLPGVLGLHSDRFNGFAVLISQIEDSVFYI